MCAAVAGTRPTMVDITEARGVSARISRYLFPCGRWEMS